MPRTAMRSLALAAAGAALLWAHAGFAAGLPEVQLPASNLKVVSFIPLGELGHHHV
jgi:hypothetical protein